MAERSRGALALHGWRRWAVVVVVLLVLAVFLFPVYWLIALSFKPLAAIVSPAPRWWFSPTLANYKTALQGVLGVALLRSLLVASAATIGALILGAGLAYPLARRDKVIRGRRQILFWVLSLWVMPPIVVAPAYYILFVTLHLAGTVAPMVLLDMVFTMPLVTWMLRSFFLQYPPEIEEAAMVDGASRLHAFVRVVVPMTLPAFVAGGLIAFILSWNEFLMTGIFAGPGTELAPAALTQFTSGMTFQWGEVAAIGTLMLLPVLIAALVAQRHLVRGLTFGAIK
jgi:multiple sugar transport system permease protein